MRSSSADPAASVRKALREGSATSIAMEAGRLLEAICDTLSWTFSVSIVRKRADRYTIGDLWPAVRKELRKTNLAETAEEIDRYLLLRNLLGAHVNEWAEGASLTEVRRLGSSVVALLDATYCADCRQWIAPAGRDAWACRCRATVLARV